MIKELKVKIKNSVILEEDIESLRESFRKDQILSYFDNTNKFSFENSHPNSINDIQDLNIREY